MATEAKKGNIWKAILIMGFLWFEIQELKAPMCYMLSDAIRRIGEYAGAVFSWHGKLGSLGPEKFQTYITGNSDEISRTLLTNQISTSTSASSKPVRVHEILKLLDGDICSYNVQGQRRLVSAIIKVSTAKVSVSPQSQNSPSSSQASRHDIYRDRSRSPLDFAKDVIYQESDVDTSDDSFDKLFQQPVIASKKPISDPQTPTPTSSLVTLLGVKPLDPIQIITPPISFNEKNLSISEFKFPRTINVFVDITEEEFPHLQGLQDTILSENRQFVKAPRPSIQLHHDGALHWVCSSN
ncbi:hypothetical protein LOD99_12473 [Oopsacas minuta]|uniref:Uncharacterized protein n=1 Tax=Oopsacas minuta TaxID=111878 RepID=A0AAV7JF77_9METZ|nr:hypothetical protein LOD99_12473 [Oopsacas minuta]